MMKSCRFGCCRFGKLPFWGSTSDMTSRKALNIQNKPTQFSTRIDWGRQFGDIRESNVDLRIFVVVAAVVAFAFSVGVVSVGVDDVVVFAVVVDVVMLLHFAVVVVMLLFLLLLLL